MPTFRPMLIPRACACRPIAIWRTAATGSFTLNGAGPPPGAKSIGRRSSRASMAQSIRTRIRWLRSAKRWRALARSWQTRPRARILLIYDYVNAWAEGIGGIGGDRVPRYGEIQSFYTGFKSLHCDIDIIPPDRDLSGYKVVVASNLRLIDDKTVDRLKAYVAGGGTLVLNYRAATQNMDNSMRLTLSPGPFTDIAGVKSEAILDLSEYNAQNGNLDANLQAGLGIGFAGSEAIFSPRSAIETLTLHGAEVIAT